MQGDDPLRRFLFTSRQSPAREALLNHRLLYDLKLAAACGNYYLETYYSDVDMEGFDIILDDQDQFRKIQVKTVMSDSSTVSWKINKTFLRPDIRFMDQFGFYEPPDGSQGGVILMEIDTKDRELNIKYYYTDIFILFAFYVNIIRRKNKRSQNRLRELFQEIRKRTSLHEMIRVPKSAFLRTKSAGYLLGLMGFHSPDSSWNFHNLMLIASREFSHIAPKHELPGPIDVLKKYVAENISKYVEDDILLYS